MNEPLRAVRSSLSIIPVTDDEIERLWERIERPLSEIKDIEVWYEVTALRESIRRLLTDREQR